MGNYANHFRGSKMENNIINQLQFAYDNHLDRAKYEEISAKFGYQLGEKSTIEFARHFKSVEGKLVFTYKRCKYTVGNNLTSIIRLLERVKKSRVWQFKKAIKPRLYESHRHFPKLGYHMSTYDYVTMFYHDNFGSQLAADLFAPMSKHISQFQGVNSVEVIL